MTFFCKYKNILGEVGKGIHSYRLFNIAIADVILTFISAVIISYIFNTNIIIVFIALMIFSVFIHYLFCVDTTLTKIVLNK